MENRQELIEKVEGLIAENRTKDAFEHLAKAKLSIRKKNQLIILKNRYSRIMDDQTIGVSKDETVQRDLNRLNRDLLIFSASIGPEGKSIKNIILLAIGISLVGVVAVAYFMKPDPGPQFNPQQKYDSLIREGNTYLDSTNCEEAENNFRKAKSWAENHEINTDKAEYGLKACNACKDVMPVPIHPKILKRKEYDSLVKLGKKLCAQNKFDKAIDAFEEAISLASKNNISSSEAKKEKSTCNEKINENRIRAFGADGIDACFAFKEDVYAFKGAEFIKYDKVSGVLDNYPKKIEKEFNLPPQFTNGLDAAFTWHDHEEKIVFMFKGDNYLWYDMNTKKVVTRPQDEPQFPLKIKDYWGVPDYFTFNLDAVLYYKGGISYLFKGQKYVKHTFGQPIEGPFLITNYWGFGEHFDNVSAAFRSSGDPTDVFVFSGKNYAKGGIGKPGGNPSPIDFRSMKF